MSQFAAMTGAVAFCWLALFQLLLAAGLPLGHLAWGGANRVLPPGQRWASLASMGLALLALVTITQAAGWRVGPLPTGWILPLLWCLVGIFSLSVLANLFGAKGAERLHGVPLASLCWGSCLVLALS